MNILKKVFVLFFTMLTVIAICLLCSASIDRNSPSDMQSEHHSYVPVIKIESSEQSDPSPVSDDESEQSESSSVSDDESKPAQESSSADSSSTSPITNVGKDNSESSTTVSKVTDYLVVKGNINGISEEQLLLLEKIIKAQTNSISFYYENLKTGISIASTPDKVYFCASVIKAPYVASILKMGIDLSDVVTISEVVGDIPAGTELTVDKLIYYTLVYSDNNSYKELIKKYGKPVFNKYSEELGIVYSRLKSGHYSDMTAYEAAVYFKDIYKYASESENGKYLTDYLKKPYYNQQIGRELGKKYTVVQKYGASYNRSVFHNTAIVYAPSPYVLSIFTEFNPSGTCTKVFRDIAAVIDEINTSVYEQWAIEVNAGQSASR